MILLKLFFSFLKIGAFSFGGGYAMLPLIQQEIIDVHGWLTVEEFIDILAIAEVTPGPIAINSATFLGYKVAGVSGSLIATIAVILPSLIIILTIAYFLKRFNETEYVNWSFRAIRPIVLGLIASAAVVVAKDAFIDIKSVLISIGVFVAIVTKKVHPILTIIIAGVLGIGLY